VYVLVIAGFVWAIVRSLRNAGPRVTPESEHRLAIGVGTAAALSIAGLFALLFTSVATGRDIGTFAKTNPSQLEIDVTGHQWWWEVKYPDSLSPYQSVTTANEIHIPINTPVLLRLATRDVIHSLWIPNLNGKRDLIPGRVNKLWIEADRPGVFRSQCAEFCGLQHAHMSLVVVAESNEKYEGWKTAQ